MLKQLLADNRIFSALVCVLVFIAGGLLYLQSVKQKGRRDVQRTQEIVTQRQSPQPQTQPVETGGGHYHLDETYHVGPHKAETPSVSTPPQPTQPREAANITPVAPPVSDVAEMNPSQKTAPWTLPSTRTSEIDRLRVLRDIRKTLPSHATMTDIVAASDFVPSEDEVAVMSDEALMALIEDATEKADAIEDEMWQRREEWGKVIDDLMRHAKTPNERERIYTEHSDRVKPVMEKMDAITYEYLIHRVTARRALNEVSQRTHESIAKFPPGFIQLQLQREAERAAREERP